MTHIDTLKVYDKLIASGLTEHQARAHSEILDASFDGVATKDDLNHAVGKLERDLKIFFGYIVVGFIVVEIIWPVIAKKWCLI